MKQEKSVPYNLRIPAKLKGKLEKEARDKKRSLNQQIIYLLENKCDENVIRISEQAERIAA